MKKLLFLLVSATAFAQQTTKVDFTSINAKLAPNFSEKSISGLVVFQFKLKQKIDTIRIDAKNMNFENLLVNGKAVAFANSGKELKIFKGYKKGNNTLSFTYKAFPKQALYYFGNAESHQIWSQGQGKYTSHWLPSFDDVNEKMIFGIEVSFDKNYTVLSNGKLISSEEIADKKSWKYQMEKPMSSYLAMLAIGNFAKENQKSSNGIPLENYLAEEDSSKFESTYKYNQQIFNFLNEEIGFDYPWEVYHQVPVKDFLYGGMENTSATIFTQDYVVDNIGFNDRNYINVNAHELAHQWFGDLVTAKTGEHHWLQEGFATYYALLAEKEIFSEDHFNWKLYETAEMLQKAAKKDTIPLQNARASTLTFYQKGAWALHVLRTNVGEENFKKAVKTYLEKHAFRNVVTDDFLSEVKKVSNYDVDKFQKEWLLESGFKVQEALTILKKNKSISQYLSVLEMANQPFEEKVKVFEEILKSDAFFPIKEEVLLQIQKVDFPAKKHLIEIALQSNDVKIRQTVAKTMREFPVEFKPQFETFLNDESYITREIALNYLWSNFPENRFQYLDKSRDWIGMNDKNLRILWLTMALMTPDFEKENKATFYDELLHYTTTNFESSVRQNAIASLFYINPNDTNVLKAFVNPLVHHKWQFSKYARDSIRNFLKKENYRTFYSELLPTLPNDEKAQLERLLKEKAE